MSDRGPSLCTMDQRADVGRRGELATESRYVARGYRVVARNWRCRLGELDLVAVHGALLVICEVKTRRGHAFGGGFEAVGWEKQRKLRQLAEAAPPVPSDNAVPPRHVARLGRQLPATADVGTLIHRAEARSGV